MFLVEISCLSLVLTAFLVFASCLLRLHIRRKNTANSRIMRELRYPLVRTDLNSDTDNRTADDEIHEQSVAILSEQTSLDV